MPAGQVCPTEAHLVGAEPFGIKHTGSFKMLIRSGCF